MEVAATRSFVAQCFWPDVTEAQVAALNDRAFTSAGELAEAGELVRYLGSILMHEDEVLLCQFEGAEDAVHRAAERARIPFERILETSRLVGHQHRPLPRAALAQERRPDGPCHT